MGIVCFFLKKFVMGIVTRISKFIPSCLLADWYALMSSPLVDGENVLALFCGLERAI